jgi:hypothetical protein
MERQIVHRCLYLSPAMQLCLASENALMVHGHHICGWIAHVGVAPSTYGRTRNEVEAVGLVMNQGMIERRRFKIPVLFVIDRR